MSNELQYEGFNLNCTITIDDSDCFSYIGEMRFDNMPKIYQMDYDYVNSHLILNSIDTESYIADIYRTNKWDDINQEGFTLKCYNELDDYFVNNVICDIKHSFAVISEYSVDSALTYLKTNIYDDTSTIADIVRTNKWSNSINQEGFTLRCALIIDNSETNCYICDTKHSVARETVFSGLNSMSIDAILYLDDISPEQYVADLLRENKWSNGSQQGFTVKAKLKSNSRDREGYIGDIYRTVGGVPVYPYVVFHRGKGYFVVKDGKLYKAARKDGMS